MGIHDSAQVTLSARNIKRIYDLFEKWQAENRQMGNQDINFVIGQLLDRAEQATKGA